MEDPSANTIGLNATKEDIEQRILEFAADNPDGINEQMLLYQMPALTKENIVVILNGLLQKGKFQLFKNKDGKTILKLQDPDSIKKVKGGDLEEQVVYKIIQEAERKGIWARDIRAKSNLHLNTVDKVLRKLEGKKLIKSLNSVQAPKKKTYLLYDLDPDESLTGGPWYSDQRFDSELVDVLSKRCLVFLEKANKTAKETTDGPIADRNASFVSSQDVLNYIMKSGITKFELSLSHIETILNTLVYDGKVEQNQPGEDGAKYYRKVNSFTTLSPLMSIPCGVCPLIDKCSDVGDITPSTCKYFKDWMNMF